MTKPVLTRDPSPAIKALLIKLVSVSADAARPQDVLDASINHLGMNLATIARMDGLSRGELKAKARRAFEDCLEMALANYQQANMPGLTEPTH